MTLLLFSGASGKIIHEQTLKQKSRDTVPLNMCWILVAPSLYCIEHPSVHETYNDG
jgi:hypothetical protein